MDADTMRLRLEQWMPIFEAQAKSGMGKNEWCDENGIRRWEFYERQKQCREYMRRTSGSASQLPTPVDGDPEFYELPAEVIPEAQPETHQDKAVIGGHIRVECGKFRISMEGQIDKNTLTALISAVSHA